jgi:crossover junction endodeoxyribonuclease RuvC
MTILGLDPGFGITGYGVIRSSLGKAELLEAGIIRSKQTDPLSERIKEIYEQLREIISEFKPEAMAVENTFSLPKFPRSGIFIGYVQGIALLAATQSKIPVSHYFPREVKKSLLGNGSATKIQMQKMIQRTFNLARPPQPDDVADAVAVALCHAGHCPRT